MMPMGHWLGTVTVDSYSVLLIDALKLTTIQTVRVYPVDEMTTTADKLLKFTIELELV